MTQEEDQNQAQLPATRPPLIQQVLSVRLMWSYRPGYARRFLWSPHFGQASVRLFGYRWIGIMWDWR
jgi:hypothetical protein